MPDYTWAVTGRVMGADRVAGTDADDVEGLPTRALERLLDRGYIQLKVEAGAGGEWRGAWQVGDTYVTGDTVSYSGGVYASKVDANVGNQPDTETAEWDVVSAPPVPAEVSQAELDAVVALMATDAELAAVDTALDARLDTVEARVGTSGTIPINTIATGSPSGKKFVRDDGTLAETTGRLLSGNGSPPPAVPTLVGATSAAQNSAAALTISLPAGTAEGDLLLMVTGRYNSSPQDPSGWTALTSYGNNEAWQKVATAADITAGSVTLPSSSQWTAAAIVAYRYAGTTPVAEFDVNGVAGTGLTSLAFDPLTVVGQKKVVRLAAGANSVNDPGTASVSGLASLTFSGATNYGWAVIAEETVTDATTPARTLNITKSRQIMTVTVELNSHDAASAQNGDWYLDKTNRLLYGPMVGGAWGTGTPLDEVTQAELDALDARVDTAEADIAALEAAAGGASPALYSGEGEPGSPYPSFVASASAGQTNGSFSLTIPAAVEEGDLMLAVLSGYAPTAPAGWTLQRTNADVDVSYTGGGNRNRAILISKVATAEDASTGTVPITDGWSQPHSITFAAYRGQDAATPVVLHAGATAAGTATLDLPSVAAPADDSVVVLFAAGISSANPMAVPTIEAGPTVRTAESGDRQSRLVADEMAPAGATQVRTVTTTAGGHSGFVVVLGSDPAGSGAEGDHYLDKTARQLYGPMTDGSWGEPTPLDDPPGWHKPGSYSLAMDVYDSTATFSMSQDRLHLIPFEVFDEQAFDQLAYEVTTAAASGSVRCGLFSFDGVTATLLQDAGAVAAATTGVKTWTISQTLTGLVLLGIVATGAPVIGRCYPSSAYRRMLPFGSAYPTAGVADRSALYVDGVSGALAASYAVNFDNKTRAPLVAMRAA